jgi:hypothetical protein
MSRLDQVERGHPPVVLRRVFSADFRGRDGMRVGALGGRHPDRIVVLSLADGTLRIRLVTCGRILDEPIGCIDWSLTDVEAIVGDQ